MLAAASTLEVISVLDSICTAHMQMTGCTREQFAVIHLDGAAFGVCGRETLQGFFDMLKAHPVWRVCLLLTKFNCGLSVDACPHIGPLGDEVGLLGGHLGKVHGNDAVIKISGEVALIVDVGGVGAA